MPTVQQSLPHALKPFEFHGLILSYREGDEEARADCPWCGRGQKLYVNAETGQYHCKVCSETGNAFSFMRRLWTDGSDASPQLEEIARDKGVTIEGMQRFGIRINPVSGEVVCPGYDANAKTNQLYRWTWNPIESRWYWNMAKGTNHWILGVLGFDHSKQTVYITEGVWDGIALWEVLRRYKRTENGIYTYAQNEGESLLTDANVIAVPTCSTFSEQWVSLFAGKRVIFLYDNDHPDRNNRIASLEGTKHAVNVLVWADEPPEEMMYLVWGKENVEEGKRQTYNPELKHGYDIRDLFSPPPHASQDEIAEEKSRAIEWLLTSLQPVPAEWVEGAKKKGKPLVEPLPCTRWEDLVPVCQKALSFHEGMDRALSIILASASSVDIGADQLWVKFIGPPSSGKTTLADGLLIARRYACLVSILTGLHSGYKGSESEGDKDYSVMAKVKGKAAIIKDGDTLLQTENRTKTLADLRDAYDRFTSTHYKNGIARDYSDHPFVLLLFGTSSLRLLDTSEMGQRMLDCVVMDGVDEKVEDDILEHKKIRIQQIMSNQATANGDRIEGKEMLLAKRMIGGYLIYLRQNIKHLVEEVKPSSKTLDQIKSLAKFVAIFRARPSTVQTEEETRELGGRLFDQLAKLAYCLAVVLNKKTFDADVMRRVRRTALDTCRGKTLNIARAIAKGGQNGKDVTSLSVQLAMPTTQLRPLLLFLAKIDIMEPFALKGRVGLGSSASRWRLTKSAEKLYAKVLK